MNRFWQEAVRREEFANLVRAHQAILVQVARKLVGEGDAEDVLQSALVAAWRRFASREEIHSARAWLLRFVVHESRNVLGSRRRRGLADSDVYEQEPASSVEDVLAALQRELAYEAGSRDPRELLDHLEGGLKTALLSLSVSERTTLLLRAIGELDYKELAETLGVPIGTVMSRLCRAREKVRVQLQRFAKDEVENPGASSGEDRSSIGGARDVER